MGIICKICQKKQSSWIQDFPLTERHLNIRICAECYDHLNDVKKGRNIDIEKNYFHKYLSSENTSSEVATVINEIFEAAEYEQIAASDNENADIPQKNVVVNENIGPYEGQDLIYSIDGVRGRHIDIYKDKVVITVSVTLGSLITHNATDGEKTIYYSDCIGVQFKQSGFTIGYLQFETASSSGNNKGSNFFVENSFTFDAKVIANERMIEVADYVKARVDAVKTNKTVVATSSTVSVADELLKLKQLLDMGVLTQEEFDNQKTKLLKG